METIISTIYFTAPAWVSNTLAAVVWRLFVVKYGWLPAAPLDFGASLGGKRVFGGKKTVVGALTTLGSAVLVGALQGRIMVGFVLGGATLLGSLLNSFSKRRLGIPESGSFFPFDQIDYAVVSLFALALTRLAPPQFSPFAFLVFAFCYQLFVNGLAFVLGFVDRFLMWNRAILDK